MFGYIQPDIPYLYVKDGMLYRAMYCGLCKSIGASCGLRSRFALSYDMTFLSAILHNIMNKDVTVEKKHCILHPIVKRQIAGDDEITRIVACVNTILTYYKLSDDVEDEKKGKTTRALFKKGYKRAKKLYPETDRIVKTHIKDLFDLEKAGCESPDMAADPFGLMVADLSDFVLKGFATEYTRNLFYGIGKWVYLIDALDDYDKDVKKKTYNPFVRAYGMQSRAEMLKEKGEEIDFIFKSVFSSNAENLKKIRFYFNHDLTDNIVLRGLPAATKRVLCGCHKKNKPEKIKINQA